MAEAAGGVEVVDAHELAAIAITLETTTATARERDGFGIGWWEICGLDVITRSFAGGDGGMTDAQGSLRADAIAATAGLSTPTRRRRPGKPARC